jgi:hypothetical protein
MSDYLFVPAASNNMQTKQDRKPIEILLELQQPSKNVISLNGDGKTVVFGDIKNAFPTKTEFSKRSLCQSRQDNAVYFSLVGKPSNNLHDRNNFAKLESSYRS